MPDRPTLAAVVVNYNYARFVGQAIESLIAQTDPFDQIIVVNDGSTDNSAQIIGRYADRVQVIDKANGGQMTASIAGLAQTSCDYVYVLDADDFVAPNLVATVRPLLCGGPAKLQFQLMGVDAEGRQLMSVFPSYVDGYDSAAMIEDNLRLGFYVCPPTAGNIYLRAHLSKMGLERLRPDEPLDGPPALAAPYLGDVISLNRPLAYYRVHGGNVSNWDRPDAALLQCEIDWLARRWNDVHAILGDRPAERNLADTLYVIERRLMIAALKGSPGMLSLVRRYLRALPSVHYRGRQKLTLQFWACLIALPIPPLRDYLVRARRSPVNRPTAVKWLLSVLLSTRPKQLSGGTLGF